MSSPAPGPVIRTATLADAALLAALGERTFREAWQGHNAPADMDAYCAANFTPRQVAADLEDPAVRYLLAELDGPVGYLRTRVGPAPPEVRAGRPIEISRVYALKRCHGRGVGPALMRACLDDATCAGHDVAWLAVWQQAAQALAFYRKWGFAEVGTTTFRLGRDLQSDFLLCRPLARPVVA